MVWSRKSDFRLSMLLKKNIILKNIVSIIIGPRLKNCSADKQPVKKFKAKTSIHDVFKYFYDGLQLWISSSYLTNLSYYSFNCYCFIFFGIWILHHHHTTPTIILWWIWNGQHRYGMPVNNFLFRRETSKNWCSIESFENTLLKGIKKNIRCKTLKFQYVYSSILLAH